ncbi:MAG TPA: aldo/keto reductase [Opitutaceae bacterium]|nr:aldo/keto reductase [Opitutaceae bacterium]
MNHPLFSGIRDPKAIGPVLGFGAGFVNYAGFDTSVATARRAWELGVRYFDTSVLYRSGISLAVLGEAFGGAGERPFLATKIGYFREARHFRSPEAMLVQLGECLRLLRRDSVDLLQVHEADWSVWWEDRSEIRPLELFDLQRDYHFADAPVVEFLRSAKAAGLCRHIGVAGNNARHLARIVSEIPGIDSVLCAYNLHPLNVTARDTLMPAAAAVNTAVIIAGVFTFVNRIPEGWRTEGTYFGRHADRQLAALKKLQQECGVPMNELALRFVAADSKIAALLVGACHPHEIEENVSRFALGPLPADLHAAIDAIARDM